MSDLARHHHYIPQGYLRGFAQKSGKRQWYVEVNDLEAKRSYKTNVRNVCGERDFMRIDMQGHSPDKIEGELAVFESHCIEAIRRVAISGSFEGEDANLTMNLMALLAVRSPEMRENIRGFHERVAKRFMHLTLETKERYEGEMQRLRATNKSVTDPVTYEDMKNFVERGEYKVTVQREHHMGTEFQLMSTVLKEIGKRRWTIYRTDGKLGEFITTNRPVTLTYIDPTNVPSWMAHSPGFALQGTEIHFPLTRNAMLVGRWDRGGYVEEAQQSFIAAVNRHMIQHSLGKVFSREKEVLYADSLLCFHRDNKLVQRFTTPPTNQEIAMFEANWGKSDASKN